MANEPFHYSTEPGPGEDVLILKLTGPLTLRNVFGFQDELRAMRPAVLIVDLTDPPYMDSAGLGLLINQYVSAENGRRKLLLAGVNHRIEALLELTKVKSVLSIYPTVEAATAAS